MDSVPFDRAEARSARFPWQLRRATVRVLNCLGEIRHARSGSASSGKLLICSSCGRFRWGPLHGYGVLLRIAQISGQALMVEQGALYPGLFRFGSAGTPEGEMGRFRCESTRQVLRTDGCGTKTAAGSNAAECHGRRQSGRRALNSADSNTTREESHEAQGWYWAETLLRDVTIWVADSEEVAGVHRRRDHYSWRWELGRIRRCSP